MRIIIDYSLVEWKELGEEEPIGNEWEDWKIGRRKDFLVRSMELAKHFIRTNIDFHNTKVRHSHLKSNNNNKKEN